MWFLISNTCDIYQNLSPKISQQATHGNITLQ